MPSHDATDPDDPGDDDREWNDPPGVDVYDDGSTGGDSSNRRDRSTEGEPKGALNVATEGESFVGEGDRARQPITPGDVSLEGAIFVVLGVAVTLFTAAQFVI